MKKVVRLTESELVKIVKKVLEEQSKIIKQGDGSECYMWGEVPVCIGDESEYVKSMQKYLNTPKCCGDCVRLEEDGIFGPLTKERLLFSKKTCMSNMNLKPFKKKKERPVEFA